MLVAVGVGDTADGAEVELGVVTVTTTDRLGVVGVEEKSGGGPGEDVGETEEVMSNWLDGRALVMLLGIIAVEYELVAFVGFGGPVDPVAGILSENGRGNQKQKSE